MKAQEFRERALRKGLKQDPKKEQFCSKLERVRLDLENKKKKKNGLKSFSS